MNEEGSYLDPTEVAKAVEIICDALNAHQIDTGVGLAAMQTLIEELNQFGHVIEVQMGGSAS